MFCVKVFSDLILRVARGLCKDPEKNIVKESDVKKKKLLLVEFNY